MTSRLKHLCLSLALCGAALSAFAAEEQVPSMTKRLGQAALEVKVGEPAKGYAVVIGGALKSDNDEVWGRMVELSGGKGARWRCRS